MIKDLKPLLIGTIALITITSAMTWFGNKVSAIGCDHAYGNSGMEYMYSFSNGCEIKTHEEVWASSKKYRRSQDEK